jgi:hypothetical protein
MLPHGSLRGLPRQAPVRQDGPHPLRPRKEFFDRILDDQAASDHYADAISQPFDVLDRVAGEQDRTAATTNGTEDRLEEFLAGDGIEAGGGLVEDQDLRFVGEGQQKG